MIIEGPDHVTEAVLAEIERAPDQRFREVMSALVKHLHSFIREVKLSEEEFHQACAIINSIGQSSNSFHNEAVLASGSLGVSTLVCLLNNGKNGATETTANLLGPFWRLDSPRTENGGSIVRSPTPGPELFVNAWAKDRDGKPVVGAEVRRFNRSKAAASAGPYPMKGLKGDVWGVSNTNGDVLLDTLQKFDPRDNTLGNNIYFFYIEPVGHAPLFIGPVEAGENLGEIKVGPFLEASGEIRGTPAELQAFAAEWDQPQPMKRGNGETEWEYAESAKLETQRDGDKLTFHLSDLRPGKLRIVSRFKTGGKPVSHAYSRREPNEDDVIFEIDLRDSRDDLVVTTKGNKK
jgi:hypothetical protein